MFVAVYNEVGDNCDGHTRFLGRYKSEAEARKAVIDDMEQYHLDNKKLKVNYPKMEIFDDGFQTGCSWDVFEVKPIEVNPKQ